MGRIVGNSFVFSKRTPSSNWENITGVAARCYVDSAIARLQDWTAGDYVTVIQELATGIGAGSSRMVAIGTRGRIADIKF